MNLIKTANEVCYRFENHRALMPTICDMTEEEYASRGGPKLDDNAIKNYRKASTEFKNLDLEHEAAVFLEECNISGDSMIDLDINGYENIQTSAYLHDLMAGFVKKIISSTLNQVDDCNHKNKSLKQILDFAFYICPDCGHQWKANVF